MSLRPASNCSLNASEFKSRFSVGTAAAVRKNRRRGVKRTLQAGWDFIAASHIDARGRNNVVQTVTCTGLPAFPSAPPLSVPLPSYLSHFIEFIPVTHFPSPLVCPPSKTRKRIQANVATKLRLYRADIYPTFSHTKNCIIK